MATHLTVPLASDAPRRDPAPGELELLRQFANTYDIEAGGDLIGSPAQLETWLRERGLLPTRSRLTDADVAATAAYRDAVRLALLANAGHADPSAAQRALDQVAGRYPVRVRLDGPARLEPSGGPGAAPAIARLIGTMYDAMTGGTWERLKICRNDECAWAYYDHSRNRSGAWCRMAECGNRMKGRAFRARHAKPAEA